MAWGLASLLNQHNRSYNPPCPEWTHPFQSPGAYQWHSTHHGAMSVPAVWRSVTLLASLIGGLPLHGYVEQLVGPPVRMNPTPPLLEDPSPPMTPIDVVSTLVFDLLMDGNAIALVASRDPISGWPTALTPVNASAVSVAIGAHGQIVYKMGGDLYGVDEILHVRGVRTPGSLRGMGLLEAASGTFNLASEQISQARGVSQHGVPTGLLKADDPSLTPQDMANAKAAWMEAQRHRTVAWLSSSVTFTPLSWTPAESQLVEARKMSTSDIALLFGLPGSFLNVESGSLTYSNVGMDGLSLLKFTVDQHLVRLEQELTRHLPRGVFARFNRDAILATDTASRYAAHSVALLAGFLTIDEVRAIEDLPPLPQAAGRDFEEGGTDG